MEIINCRRCHRIFRSFGRNICPECLYELDGQFRTVREYLYEHGAANVFEVAEATGVSETLILEFLREERLELTQPSLGFCCEKCGQSIITGRYCEKCSKVVDGEARKGTYVSKRDGDGKQVHVIDRVKRHR